MLLVPYILISFSALESNPVSITSELHLSDWIAISGFVGSILLGVAIASWAASQWFGKQFSATRHLIDLKIEKLEANIVSKLEYHEKHDDTRFDTQDQRMDHLHNDLWEIRVRNAAIDANKVK